MKTMKTTKLFKSKNVFSTQLIILFTLPFLLTSVSSKSIQNAGLDSKNEINNLDFTAEGLHFENVLRLVDV